MENCERRVECAKMLSENVETEIRRNVVIGMTCLCGTASQEDEEKAVECFRNIMFLLDGIRPENYIIETH